MAKKDKKTSKKKDSKEPAEIVDAVRGAVERTLQGSGEGGRSLLDDVASAAQRIRESFDDLRVLEDVRGLRAEVEALSRRVAELEKKQAAAPKSAAAPATATPKAAPKRAASKPKKAPAKASAAATAAAKTGPAPKPAASKPRSRTT